jgi:hypothetical protein
MEVARMHSKYASAGTRSTFAVNTFYDEISGGYYINRALFALIGAAMDDLEIFPVILDVWTPNGLNPIEGEGHFMEREEYALVRSDSAQIGLLLVWQFQAGGGGPYYGDNVIFDLILPEDTTQRLVEQVEERCRAGSVRFSRAVSVGQ